MCDTFVSLAGHNQNHRLIFAKNSDREPNEAHELLYVPATKCEEKTLKCTYIEIPQVAETHAVILSKPFQMWGAEMGCNEHGLVIGNEALFTKEKFKKKDNGLTGMDLLRLALERCKHSAQALEIITELLEKYGQDACGGYKNKYFYYSNSFLIADLNESWVLETAGKHWAARKVEDFYSISNGISIGENFDLSSKNLIDNAKKKGWLKKAEKFHFGMHYSDSFFTKMSNCQLRRSATYETLKAHDGKFTIDNALKMLQRHNLGSEFFSPALADTSSICMHANGLTNPNSTTGSMIVELQANKLPVVWLTGTSHACTSLFKPFSFHENSLLLSPLFHPSAIADQSLWWRAEKISRKAATHYMDFKIKIHSYLNSKQQNLISKAENLRPGSSEWEALEKEAMQLQEILLNEYQQILHQCNKEFRPLFKLFMHFINKAAKL
jgi:dipeptidase